MDDETTRLRALYEGIALPWKAQPTVVDGDEVECLALVLCPYGDDGDTTTVAEIDMGHGIECDDAHAALIVAAVNALPGLLDAAERAERELATATASVRQLRADVELATAQRDAETCRADNTEGELAVLRAQQAPLVACVDALRAAARDAGWRDADATGETLVAWVRHGVREACARIARAHVGQQGMRAPAPRWVDVGERIAAAIEERGE